MNDHRRRFRKAKGKIRVTKKDNEKRVEPMDLAFLAALHLLARTKHLFYATLQEIENGNTYSSFVLVRAYFETCMAIGFLYLAIERKLKRGDMEGIWKTSSKILEGGKNFPKNDYHNKDEAPPIGSYNIYDYFDEVDSYLKKIGEEGDGFAPHREVYDTVLSEFSHPNFMGLATASYNGTDELGKDYQEVDLERKGVPEDKEGCRNYLIWGGDIFFYFWDKLVLIFHKHNLELPKL